MSEIDAQVRLLADELMSLSFRLAGLILALPPSPAEAGTDDLAEHEEADLRSVLLCLLEDHVRPAAQGLRAATGLHSADSVETVFEVIGQALARRDSR